MAENISISVVTSPEDLAALEELLAQYTDNVRRALIDSGLLVVDSSEAQNLNDDYLSSLHNPPEGCMMLATSDGEPAGCVMMRRIDDDACEMKRLYVREAHRGEGIGWALIAALITYAQDLGFRRMRLSTHIFMNPAIELYEQFDFTVIDDYHHDPLQGTLCMERDLS